MVWYVQEAPGNLPPADEKGTQQNGFYSPNGAFDPNTGTVKNRGSDTFSTLHNIFYIKKVLDELS